MIAPSCNPPACCVTLLEKADFVKEGKTPMKDTSKPEAFNDVSSTKMIRRRLL
jgi:hypothetical protein